ncbi:MAG: dihydropteroate synthase [Candidatus Zixiibacteriota bacterium]|nr:MAG: dihydropteroate synthase [candidate division Zixibacteria bacterium]
MGVLNITTDSFSDGGKFIDPEKALDHAYYLAESGADILDIGGESSRPGAESIPTEEEIKRVIPVIKKAAKKIKIPISVDTVKSEVAERAFDAGASILNDISALRTDEKMAALVAGNNAYVILMHMRGTPTDMQENTEYDNIIGEICEFLNNSALKAIEKGIGEDKIIIDPGIGFGKSAEGNFIILKNLDKFVELGYPVMVGGSRKSFIGKALAVDTDQRLEGSIAAACYAVMNGADIIRAHDVIETRRAITIIEKISAADRA